LKQSGRPYISLADFELNNGEIRRELVKHIGAEFDSVIAADITDRDSGAKRIDKTLGKSFQGLSLGTRTATTVFLYSFSGGLEKGAHLGEIKRSATTMENPSSVIAEAIEQMKGKLLYLQSQTDKYFFSNQPNLNHILLTKMENIKAADVIESERDHIGQQIRGDKLKLFIWPDKPKDIPDTEELKLIIVPEKKEAFMKEILETKGDTPRVHKNTIFFLCPSESEKASLQELVKRRIAYEQIGTDKTLNLTPDQRKDVTNNLRKEEDNLRDAVRRTYRTVYTPAKSGIREIDIGIPTYGERKEMDQEVYEKLRMEGEILERIAPILIKEKYLPGKDYVNLKQISDSMLNTPGERRMVNIDALQEGVRQGVKLGLFGLGEADSEGNIVCRFFKEDPIIAFGETEALIKESVCIAQHSAGPTLAGPIGEALDTGSVMGKSETSSGVPAGRVLEEVVLRFKIPRGKVAQVMGVMNYLQSKFQTLEMEIRAKSGSLTEQEYADKIREALRQLGIDV
jgi:hypothetical protein